MSLTITNQPNLLNLTTLLSAGNDSHYSVSGSTYLQPNIFAYKFFADIYVDKNDGNGLVYYDTTTAFPDPIYNTFGDFNISKLISNALSYDFTHKNASPLVMVENCPNTSIRVQLKFGEEYTLASVSGSTYVQNRNLATSNTSIYLNASLSFTDQATINLQNYIYQSNALWLQPSPTQTIIGGTGLKFTAFTNQRRWLYYVNDISNSHAYTNWYLNTYDANNTLVGSYHASTGTTYTTATDIQRIAIGYSQIASLTGGQYTVDSGPSTIFGATVTSYEMYLGGLGVSPVSVEMDIAIDCTKYASGAYTLHWMNTFGGFDSWLFNKKSETTQNKEVSTFKKTYGKLGSDGKYTINTYDRNQVQYYTKIQNSIEVNSDNLADTDVIFLSGLFTSPLIYMEDQNGVLIAATITADSNIINKIVNQKIYQLSLTLEPAANDFRQSM